MEQDRLSNLPKTILHDILSRLPEEDAARTSVLSKAWAETWSSFPILSFCDTKIIGTLLQPKEDYLRKRKKFLDYVERSLLRFRNQGLAIKEFKLRVNCLDLHHESKDVDLWMKLDHWMKLASESGVEVLELYLSHDDRGNGEEGMSQWFRYIFPTDVLEAKSLTKLVLMGRIRFDRAFMDHSMKFFSLRVLSLGHVLLGDEQALQHLISHCPFIEYITLKWCYVLNPGGEGHLLESHLSMHGLPKLKGVDVRGIQEVYVDAPSLENLFYCPGDLYAPSKLDFDRCRNLRELCLWSLKNTIIADKWFLELFEKFPFLESLKLFNCRLSERINISSVQLKVLQLSNCFNSKEVNIDAPNLLSCAYAGHHATKPIISFLRSSSQLEVNVLIHIYYQDLCNLREFIQDFKSQTALVSVTLFIHQSIADDALNPVVLQVSSPPPSIKHLVLHAVPINEALYLPLVYSLLSSCCPATISISLHSLVRNKALAFIECFYETLKGKNKDECFCSSGDTKCWWHGLKDVKVTSSMNTDENVDLKTILDALPTSAAQENISFRLEF